MAEQPSSTATTVSTWVYVLHASGASLVDDAVKALCEAVDRAESAEAGDAAGMALVEAIASRLESEEPAAVRAVVASLFGDRVGNGLGEGDRGERTHRVRRYQFGTNLPWLARIWERSNGTVAPNWVIVQRVTDEVTAMDPNPWDDIDEERHLPVADFQVLWELDGCTSIHLDGA